MTEEKESIRQLENRTLFCGGMPVGEQELQNFSSIALAHVGDAVFELLVRTKLCVEGKITGRGLHQATIRIVCAESQSAMAQKIMPLLTEQEQSVFRRGRNA